MPYRLRTFSNREQRDARPQVDIQKAPDLKAKGLLVAYGGPYRDRTYDLGIKSPLLYQLS